MQRIPTHILDEFQLRIAHHRVGSLIHPLIHSPNYQISHNDTSVLGYNVESGSWNSPFMASVTGSTGFGETSSFFSAGLEASSLTPLASPPSLPPILGWPGIPILCEVSSFKMR